MTLLQRKELFGMNISLGDYAAFTNELINKALLHESRYVCVANVHMVVEANNDRRFADVVNNADIVTPDGMPLKWALRLLYGIKQARVAGMDMLPDLLEMAAKQALPVYFYGGTDDMLKSTREHLIAKYPALTIAGMYSPPFRPLNNEEEIETAQQINNSGARLVFVVLGCPKQEKWMASMKDKVNAVMIGVGGALPVLIGMQTRAPVWMQKSGMEWLFRLAQEPGRLFKRYFYTNCVFAYLFIKAFFSRKR